MDRRLTPFNGRVAHVSLRGQVAADQFVEGERHVVAAPVADLLTGPNGARDRQLLRGEGVILLEVTDGLAFGYAEKDGYVGWIDPADLIGAPSDPPTHRVCAAQTYGKSTPGLKAMGRITPLSLGARVTVIEESGGWARVAWRRGTVPQDIFVPMRHLASVTLSEPDPVTVAERLLGAPYLWGGNSSFGIDCSGLVQMGCTACDIPCLGDSDMQEAMGQALTPGTPPARGNLMFWKGHVAWVSDTETLLHANAFHMAVVYEPIASAIARIAAQGDGPVIRHARLS